MQVDAVIVAAGRSTRFGDTDKLWALLGGKPVLAWSLETLGKCESIARIVVVVRDKSETALADLVECNGPKGRVQVVTGGSRRRDSVEAGLRACSTRYVAIHDGARPLVTIEVVARAVAAAEEKPGAIAAVPSTDTIKQVRGTAIVGHPERETLWSAQTPQVVLRQAWLDAAKASDGDETDDAAMLARLGLECEVALGDPTNIKITRPEDLLVAEQLLALREGRD
jgi:2-C-methyl-D-erythritol 4-phosphate cytidylyltransferase